MKVSYFIVFLAVGFILGYFYNAPVNTTQTGMTKIDTLYQRITVRDTLTQLKYRVLTQSVDVDSLYNLAKDEVRKTFKVDTLPKLSNILYEAAADTLVRDSLSEIYVKASYFSRLPLDPKRRIDIEIDRTLFIPEIYIKEEQPFYKEKSFVPAVALAIIAGVLIAK